MHIEETKLKGVLRIEPDVFEDHRGKYIETYNQKIYRDNGIDIAFIQDDISVSDRHVLRGIHGDGDTWKLISCLHGKFYLLVVNNDPEAPQYRQWQSFILSEENRFQVLVPPTFGNGHVVLSDRAIFHYKQSTYYNPGQQFTIKWDDPAFDFWWPIKTPILSQRDECGDFPDT